MAVPIAYASLLSIAGIVAIVLVVTHLGTVARSRAERGARSAPGGGDRAGVRHLPGPVRVRSASSRARCWPCATSASASAGGPPTPPAGRWPRSPRSSGSARRRPSDLRAPESLGLGGLPGRPGAARHGGRRLVQHGPGRGGAPDRAHRGPQRGAERPDRPRGRGARGRAGRGRRAQRAAAPGLRGRPDPGGPVLHGGLRGRGRLRPRGQPALRAAGHPQRGRGVHRGGDSPAGGLPHRAAAGLGHRHHGQGRRPAGADRAGGGGLRLVAGAQARGGGRRPSGRSVRSSSAAGAAPARRRPAPSRTPARRRAPARPSARRRSAGPPASRPGPGSPPGSNAGRLRR